MITLFDNIYYFATTEYGDVVPETIRRTEQEAVAETCKLLKCTEAEAFKHGANLGRINVFGTAFKAMGEIEYLRGFRAKTEQEK